MKTVALACLFALLLLNGFSSIGLCQDAAAIPDNVIEMSIAKDPNNHAVRIIAGFHYFDSGDFAKAVENFSWASKLTPDDPYDQIWLYMAEIRQNPKASDGEIRSFLKQKETKEFVYTDIKILLGNIGEMEAVQKARVSGDLGDVCEANYYMAQRCLAKGEKIKAREFLNETIKTKKNKFWEYKSAVACLKTL